MTIGGSIRIQRLTKGYTQDYMAFRLNVSQNTYSKIEREEVKLSVKKLYEIVEILEIPLKLILPEIR